MGIGTTKELGPVQRIFLNVIYKSVKSDQIRDKDMAHYVNASQKLSPFDEPACTFGQYYTYRFYDHKIRLKES